MCVCVCTWWDQVPCCPLCLAGVDSGAREVRVHTYPRDAFFVLFCLQVLSSFSRYCYLNDLRRVPDSSAGSVLLVPTSQISQDVQRIVYLFVLPQILTVTFPFTLIFQGRGKYLWVLLEAPKDFFFLNPIKVRWSEIRF